MSLNRSHIVLNKHVQSRMARFTRRTALSMLGVTGSVAVMGGVAMNGVAPASAQERDNGHDDDPLESFQEVRSDLRPGGTYDQFLRDLAAQDQFSGNVLLAHRGRAILTRSYGMAHKAQDIPNRPETLFLLASVTKAFTATAVLQLVQNGQVALDATLGTYLSDFTGDAATRITIHHLLTMTSGLGDYSQMPGWYQESKTWTSASAVLDGTMSYILAEQPQFPPGSGYFYSNSGFVILGKIVAQVAGVDYWDYMRRNVFRPAGMTRTDFYTRDQVLGMMADGTMAHNYASQHGGARVDLLTYGKPMFIGLPDGAGGPHTTAADMLAFATALRNGTLLRPDYVRLALNGKTPLSPLPTPFDDAIQLYFSGYGLTDTLINDRHILSHAGEGPGVTSNLDIYPTLDWVAIVLENYDLQPFGLIPDACPLVKLERQLITRSQ